MAHPSFDKDAHRPYPKIKMSSFKAPLRPSFSDWTYLASLLGSSRCMKTFRRSFGQKHDLHMSRTMRLHLGPLLSMTRAKPSRSQRQPDDPLG
ncbi:hypothetical protein K523DRAFT_166661 [Schizophyllum commune Tattone D]|nr:hypothetical protein K523DRAFT_166661 [Schizophyllum commune Tattone D]